MAGGAAWPPMGFIKLLLRRRWPVMGSISMSSVACPARVTGEGDLDLDLDPDVVAGGGGREDEEGPGEGGRSGGRDSSTGLLLGGRGRFVEGDGSKGEEGEEESGVDREVGIMGLTS